MKKIKIVTIRKKILNTGIIAISALLLVGISDIIMLYRPTAGNVGYADRLKEISELRIFIGALLGTLIMPLSITLAYQLWIALKNVGKIIAGITAITMAYFIALAAVLHWSFLFIGITYRKIIQNITLFNIIAEDFNTYLKIISMLVGIILLVCSIFLIIAILTKKSLYPRWMAIFNPAVIVIVIKAFIGPVIPAPIGGFFSATSITNGIFLFTILSTLVLLKAVREVNE